MSSQEAEQHALVASRCGAVADRVRDWDAATPVPEWRAVDIVDHLIEWSSGVLQAWAGIEFDPAPDADPAARWRSHAERMAAVLDDPDRATRAVAGGPFDGQPLAAVLDRIYTPDVFMHTIDLARAAGILAHAELDRDYAAGILAGIQAMGAALQASGQYGPPFTTDSTDPVEQLAAAIGRDPAWSPSA